MELPTWYRLNIEGYDDEVFVTERDGCIPHLSAFNRKLNLEIAVTFRNDEMVSVFIAIPRSSHRQSSGRIMTEPGMHLVQMHGFDPIMVRCLALNLAEQYKDHIPTEVTADV